MVKKEYELQRCVFVEGKGNFQGNFPLSSESWVTSISITELLPFKTWADSFSLQDELYFILMRINCQHVVKCSIFLLSAEN